MSYFKHIKQDVVADPLNSSTANLTSGNSYMFSGSAASTLGVAGVQVSLYTDKGCTVVIEQSPDGTNWDLSDRYRYDANDNFGVTVQAVSSYVRVLVTTANETTTYFRLQTALCPIVEAVPRSLTEFGNLKVTLSEDTYGFGVENTPTDELRVVEPVRLVGSSFDGNTVDQNFWTPLNDIGAAGSVTQSGTEMILSSGSANGAYARVYSVRRARFVNGSSLRFRAHVRLGDTGVTNNKRRWGCAWGSTMPTITDGCYFELDGTTFSVVTLKGSVETRVSSGSFNGHQGYTYTPTTDNMVYEIYLTNSACIFAVGEEVLHKVSATSATWTNTLSPHVWADNANAAAIASSRTLNIRSMGISRLGKYETAPTYKNITAAAATVCKYGGGILHKLLFNNPANKAVIIYDNTSAASPIIATITPAAGQAPFYFDFGVPFFTGLTIDTTAGAQNLTLIYE